MPRTIEPIQRELLLGQLEQCRRKIAYFDSLTLAVSERVGEDCEGAEVIPADEARALSIFETCYAPELK